MDVYERVANEYYDSALHPTCANLRTASDFGLQSVLARSDISRLRCLELGAGESSLATSLNASPLLAVCIDLNPGMLAHTPTRTHASVADARTLPFADDTFDFVVGSLVDPFNVTSVYAEADRVLRSGGQFIFTVPDVIWVRHNQMSDSLPEHTAGLTLQDGETIILPSYVWPYEEQQRRLLAAGFASVQRLDVPLAVIDRSDLSRRFLDSAGEPAFEYIVTVYSARSA